MDLTEVPSAEVIPVLRLILGGRTKEAMSVRERMDKVAEDMKNQYEQLAGFFIVVWDDEGFATSESYFGHRFPMPPTQVLTSINELAKADMFVAGGTS